MQIEDKLFIEKIIEIMKSGISKEKQLNEIFGTNSNIYKKMLEELQNSIFERLNLNYGYDGEDDGNYEDGLFSFVINGTITIWELVQYREEINSNLNKYVQKEIDLDTYYENILDIGSKYNIY